ARRRSGKFALSRSRDDPTSYAVARPRRKATAMARTMRTATRITISVRQPRIVPRPAPAPAPPDGVRTSSETIVGGRSGWAIDRPGATDPGGPGSIVWL